MGKTTLTVDAHLDNWQTVKDAHEWTGLLAGNGASRAVWEGFHYSSLCERATAADGARPLAAQDVALFGALKTINFETVLASLQSGEALCRALGQDTSAIRERYQSVQEALIATVRQVHVPRQRLTEEIVGEIQAALTPYWRVYTTNYDLLFYWASLHDGRAILRDYFWAGNGGRFDVADARPYPGTRTILYLHGGLHLIRIPSGETRKLTKEGGKLLDQFGGSLTDGSVPLIVTEGTADDKLAAIRRSDYLSFAYQQFARHEGPLVVFGHQLGAADEHLVQLMRQWSERVPIAISMRRADPRTIVARKAELHDRLKRDNLIFFDAATHPLGSGVLRVRKT